MMTRSASPLIARAGALAIAALLAGCGTSPPSNFYLMTTLAHRDGAVGTNGPSLGIAPLVLADYLDRPQIVSRSDENTLELDEFHRWGEPLKNSLLRLLVINLSVLLESDNIAPLPWRHRAAMDFQVSVEIDRFERSADGDVILAARWLLTDAAAEPKAVSHRSFIRRPGGYGDHATLAAAMSQAYAELCREIADAVRR